MGKQDIVVCIFSDMLETNCKFFVRGEDIVTVPIAISEAMDYWRKHKLAVAQEEWTVEHCNKIKFALITSIQIIYITPR